MLHAFLLTLSGIPVLYSGDEVGRQNDRSYREDPAKAADSRYLHRGRFDWDAVKRSKDKTTVEGRIFGALRSLVRIRSKSRVFVNEADTWLVPLHSERENSVLGIGRYHNGEKLLAFFNFSAMPQAVYTEEKEDYIRLAASGPQGNAGEHHPGSIGSFLLPGYGFTWFTHTYPKQD